jgi:hypothetical protein
MKTFIRSLFLMQVFLLFNSNNLDAQTFTWASGIVSAQPLGISNDAMENSFLVGEFTGTATFGTVQLTSDGINNSFLAKYDPEGNCIWATRLGGGKRITVDSFGFCYITGTFEGTKNFGSFQITSFGQYDMFVAKYDPNGNCLWANHAGSSTNDHGMNISIDVKGYSYIFGDFSGTAIFDTIQLTGSGVYIAKYDSYGKCLWAEHVGDSNSGMSQGITVDANGNIYITGSSFGGFLAKYNSNGNLIWIKQPGYVIGYSVSVDTIGNSYTAGYFQGTVLFGSIQLISHASSDIFIVKYDSSGNCLWAKQAGGISGNNSYSIATDINGNSFITGTYTGAAIFDTNKLTGYGNTDIFIAKYDPNGNCLWAKQAGSKYMDQGWGISAGAYGGVFVTGFCGWGSVFGSILLNSNTGAFVSKITDVPLPVELSSFNYQLLGNSVNLDWITQTETNNKCFEIERKNQSTSWIKIGEVKGSGTSNYPKQYSFVDKSISNGRYTYRLKQIDYNGQFKYSNELEVNFIIPDKYSLEQNYPNPFNPSSTINYSLAKDGNVKLVVYNSLGSKVTTIVNEFKQAGNYSVQFNGGNLPSGIYFYRLEAGQFTQVRKMMLLK